MKKTILVLVSVAIALAAISLTSAGMAHPADEHQCCFGICGCCTPPPGANGCCAVPCQGDEAVCCIPEVKAHHEPEVEADNRVRKLLRKTFHA